MPDGRVSIHTRLIIRNVFQMKHLQALFRWSGSFLAMHLLAFATTGLRADESNTVVIQTMHDLARCQPGQLEALFAHGSISGIPTGRLNGLPLVNPGSASSETASRGGRLVWSGKVISADGSRARNFFFGLPSVPAKASIQPSLRDGRPALVLDYTETSLVYRYVRDEIREVSPGVYLGYVDDTRTAEPASRRWFAFEAPR